MGDGLHHLFKLSPDSTTIFQIHVTDPIGVQKGVVFQKRCFPQRVAALYSGQRKNVEKLWQNFFSDPSQWWDNRLEKENPRYPDFKHKETQASLWLNNKKNPPWVEAQLDALEPGTVPLTNFSWNRRLAKYVQGGQFDKALELFQQMQGEGVNLDMFTFVPVVNACARLGAIGEGRCIHAQIIQSGCETDSYVGSSLIDMYTRCGSMEEAWTVFNKVSTHNVVAWTAMILGFVKCAQGQNALQLFWQMQQVGVKPDAVTLIAVLNACASIPALQEGRQVHKYIIQRGCESDTSVGNSLVDMYVKCGSIEDAWRVFNKMPSPDVVAWTAIILGYVKCGQGKKALDLSQEMQNKGLEPNPVTFVGLLNACASTALEVGRGLHEQIMHSGLNSDVFVGNSLIDMYSRCGSIEDAKSVFNKMATRDVVSWAVMLRGYAVHGHAKEALRHFEQMCQEGVALDAITFVSLLSACSHAGLVDEGLDYFESMASVYNVSATVEHYYCLVDLLGRAGHLQEAEDMIKNMTCAPDVHVWRSLLGACRVHGNLEIGERSSKHVLELDPRDVSVYATLSSIYVTCI